MEEKKATEEEISTVIKREWDAHAKQWKSTLEEFELQLALGKAEASEKLEEWKKTFRDQVNQRKSQFFSKVEEPGWEDVKRNFDHLEVQLALGKMELKDAYEEQKDSILEAIDAAKRSLNQALGKVDEEFHDEAETFRSKLEGFQVQFALGKYEARDALEEKKKELREMVQEFRTRMATVDTIEEDGFNTFVDEMKKSYEHLKSAFSGLID